ncbi:MAG TPA: hypothetical protein DC054_07500 [Blastocatellia bacterium]|nr:hypothetical protein [Blastocatellia bacterium]
MRLLSALLSLGLFLAPVITGQVTSASLQPGKAIERTLPAGQTHSYTITLEKDQFIQLAVEQRGVDVVIRVFLPDGQLLRQFDSPTGTEGTEYAEIISDTPGPYRIEVARLNDAEASGKYEIKIVDLRKATDEELRFRKNEGTRKAKGLALLIETSRDLDQLHAPETSVTMRIRAAELLWPTDEKKASALMAKAIETITQIILDNTDREQDFEDYQLMMKLRQQVISALAPHDPEAALKFFQATRMPNDVMNESVANNQELQLEASLINQVATADPKRAFELAEDLLKRSSSTLLIQTLTSLASKDRELAMHLAHDMARKIQAEDFKKTPETAYLSTSLFQIVRNVTIPRQDGDSTQPGRLLSDEELRDLFLKIISELLSYSSSEQNVYAPEYAVARNLAAFVAQMDNEVKAYAADRSDAISKKVIELGGSATKPAAEWQRYQIAITKEPVDTALESVELAPSPMRNSLYQQIVNRVAATGDVSRAQQIVSNRITNASQRKQMLHALQEQAVTSAAEKGKFDEALQLLSKFRPSERNALVNQIVDHIGPGVKKSQAVQYLEQARNLVTTSGRAEDKEQMQTLLAIARAFARHDTNRSFQIVEPLIDQFNEICTAAVTMNGFGQQYYRNGEMNTSNENSVAEIANQISDTLGTLAMYDFDRAKRDAQGISRLDERLRTFLMIAEHTLEIPLDSDESEVEPTS